MPGSTLHRAAVNCRPGSGFHTGPSRPESRPARLRVSRPPRAAPPAPGPSEAAEARPPVTQAGHPRRNRRVGRGGSRVDSARPSRPPQPPGLAALRAHARALPSQGPAPAAIPFPPLTTATRFPRLHSRHFSPGSRDIKDQALCSLAASPSAARTPP